MLPLFVIWSSMTDESLEDALSAESLFTVTAAEVGTRLDQFCQTKLTDVSRARVQAWIDDGCVLVNERAARASLRLKAGDSIAIEAPPVLATTIAPEAIPLAIIYEDAHLLVLDKPQGMVVHPAPGNASGTLVNALLHHCRDLSGIGGVARPGIVHRLDKDTSGLLVVAKTDQAHQSLSGQIAAKTALRQYWAVVGGHMASTTGRVDAPVSRHPTHRLRMAVVEGGRMAATRWSTLETFRGYSLLELTLETGRTHQIRVHLAHLGHALVGDLMYGGDMRLSVKLAGQALHARRLGFNHPVTGEAMQFEAEPPENFRKLLAYLGQTMA